MDSESSGGGSHIPRIYELIKDSPKTGRSPTVWAWPQLIEHLKVAAQPVQGPWPPHQEPRPEPDADSLPVAIADPQPPPAAATPPVAAPPPQAAEPQSSAQPRPQWEDPQPPTADS